MQTYDQERPLFGGGGGGFVLPSLTPVVKRLLIAFAAIWVATVVLDLAAPQLLSKETREADGSLSLTGLIPFFGATPYVWFDGFPWIYPWQPLTFSFLHDPLSPWHLLTNALMLYFFGTMLEGTLGSRRFLSFYLLATVIAGCTSMVLRPMLGQVGPTIGASGGAMAVVCAAAAMNPRATVLFWFIPIPLAWLAIGLVGFDVFNAIQQVFADRVTGKDHFAHLAGAGFGFVAVRRGLIWRDALESLERKREERVQKSRADDEAKLDELLERIHERGLQSLSEREKAFLKRMSKRS